MKETNCAMCGRALKDASSIARGYGPVCWGRVLQAAMEQEDADMDIGEGENATTLINQGGKQ